MTCFQRIVWQWDDRWWGWRVCRPPPGETCSLSRVTIRCFLTSLRTRGWPPSVLSPLTCRATSTSWADTPVESTGEAEMFLSASRSQPSLLSYVSLPRLLDTRKLESPQRAFIGSNVVHPLSQQTMKISCQVKRREGRKTFIRHFLSRESVPQTEPTSRGGKNLKINYPLRRRFLSIISKIKPNYILRRQASW